MKRKVAIEHCRVAGYHGDQKKLIRVYVENRVSIDACREAYAKGEHQRRISPTEGEEE